jgi:hypothetical protein
MRPDQLNHTVERLFSNSTLLIPTRLHESVLREGFRPERQTAIFLIYDLIVHKCSGMKGKWTHISDRAFSCLVKNHSRKSAEKKWLEHNGFIEIKKWRAEDGSLKNSKIPGRKTQAYRVVEQEGESVWVDLWKRQLEWPISVPDDPLCQFTRSVLGRLDVDKAMVARLCLGESESSCLTAARKISVLHWARTLNSGMGKIRRGQRVNRLYSPWTSAPRELRRCCYLADEPIVSIDLQASQPTLIGLLADDESFCEACARDQLYSQIGEIFAVAREDAKPIFLSYAYGPIRRPTSRNKQAFAVQNYVASSFPKTHKYITKHKAHDYREFACRLQNLEAELFLDGILRRAIKEELFALTVHDSVSVPESQSERAIAISREILAGKMSGKGRLKVENYGVGQVTSITI